MRVGVYEAVQFMHAIHGVEGMDVSWYFVLEGKERSEDSMQVS